MKNKRSIRGCKSLDWVQPESRKLTKVSQGYPEWETWMVWLPLCRRHFQMCFHEKSYNLIISGTYKTQELPCGIRVAGDPWPVKMAINITSSGWPQGRLFPWALKGQGLKGSNMIVCVLLVSNSRGCCLVAPGITRAQPEWSPCSETTPEGVWHQQYTHNPDYNMMSPFFSTATNILLIKSNLKFESRATVVSVAMSPRYLGGKYRSRLHPRSRKMRVLVFAADWACEIEQHQTASSASRGDNEVDHELCLNAECQMHTVVSNENGKFYTIMIYPCFSRSVCFSMGSPAWWRFGLCSSGSSLVSRWCDAPLVLVHARISNMTLQM